MYVSDWFQFSKRYYLRVYCTCHENCWVFTNIVNGSWPQWVQFYRIRCASLTCYRCSCCITDCVIKISIIITIYHLLTRTSSVMQIKHYCRIIIFQRENVRGLSLPLFFAPLCGHRSRYIPLYRCYKLIAHCYSDLPVQKHIYKIAGTSV